MSEFLIPFVISIFGLLAQAAAGKRQRRVVVVPAVASTSNQRVAAGASQQSVGSSVVDDFAIESSTNYLTVEPKVESGSASAEVLSAETSSNELAPTATLDSVAEPTSTSDPATQIEDLTLSPAVEKAEIELSGEISNSQTDIAEPEPFLKESIPVEPALSPESAVASSSGATSGAAAGAVPPSDKVAPNSVFANLPDFEYYVSRKPGIEYFLRVVIFLWFLGLALYFFLTNAEFVQPDFVQPDPWVAQVTFATCALTGFTLVRTFRTALSYVFSVVESIFDVTVLRSLTKNWTVLKSTFESTRIYVPTSVPHMVGFFIYVQTMFYLLSQMSPNQDFQMPGMPMPMPLPMDQLFSYNGLGLVTLAFCGAGIFVTRNFKEVLSRLALVKPSARQVGIGIGIVFMSFLYDYLWSIYTHGQSMGLDTKLSGYNGGTFTAEGGFTASLILALATALFAGVGEETLIRGGLQPMLGLVPAAILHGVLHAQFQHAPIFIIQVAGWSILMGIVKKYTNTTTTIIGHAGFNFLTTFLFSFNPPDM